MIDIVAKVEGVADRELGTLAHQIGSTMQGLAPVDSGVLAGSISVVQSGRFEYIIAPHVDYAYYAENGRGEVVPVNAKALRFSNGVISKYASPYEGSHFVAKTASRYR